MNTYLVRLQGIARTKSVAAKDLYEAAEQWAVDAPASTWSQGPVTIDVVDIDDHVSTFVIDAHHSFDVRMVPA